MTARFELTAPAERDLEEIFFEVKSRHGRAVAERVYGNLLRTFDLLATQPEIARHRPELWPPPSRPVSDPRVAGSARFRSVCPSSKRGTPPALSPPLALPVARGYQAEAGGIAVPRSALRASSAAQANASGNAFATETFDPPLVLASGRVLCALAYSGLTGVTEFTGVGYLAKDN